MNSEIAGRFVNPRLPQIWHGADYNPDQWPPETLEEDLRLMDEARCQVFSVGIFAWSALEPEDGRFEFEWLDRVMDRLASAGKFAALATPSAAMPAWMAQKHPEILRTGADGVRRKYGERVNFCWSSPEYRRRCRDMAERLAKRYGGHPALVLWHISNEYGGECYCERCEASFQEWLRRIFGADLDKLNHAYWTSFWSHTFTDWSQIRIPGRPHGEESINGLSLDYRRFVSTQIVDFCKMEAEPLRAHSNVPVTTNLMGTYPALDPRQIAPHLDVIAWDSYPGFTRKPLGPEEWLNTAFRHDLNRSLKNRPFLLIECTPSSSNWYPMMQLKRPGAHRREALQALAHGADSVMYFQWRQSRGSREKTHGAVVSHDGRTDNRVFREVAALGKTLESLSGLPGAQTSAEAALIYDWENAWAIEIAGGPRRENMGYLETCLAHYRELASLSIPVDVVGADSDFSRYKLLVAPMLYMVRPGVAERLERFVEAGGTLVATYYTGYVDENDLNFLGGFPGPLRKLIGVWAEEIDGLFDGQTNAVAMHKNDLEMEGSYEARELCELVHAEDAEVLATYEQDFYSGMPALTRRRHGSGEVYYVASRNDARFFSDLLGGLARRMKLRRDFTSAERSGVMGRKRVSDDGEYLFLLNLTDSEETAAFEEVGFFNAESMEPVGSLVTLGPRGSLVLFRPAASLSNA